ncbi:MAG: hypothetical protein SAK29_36525, partial [Scytonema sp. PMC 1069.18]|nr:hypothetical protein [Scytonema sp. PMC 1069.18]MEC4887802.1 hypothetical protein [Scytonema sp. PMC 1070.18]
MLNRFVIKLIRIINLIRNIIEKLSLISRSFQSRTSRAVTLDDYRNFLFEILQVTGQSKGDKEAVYPLLEANQDIAIAGYITALSVYTRDAFPENWAMTQYNLGIAYNDRKKGERGENLELAI